MDPVKLNQSKWDSIAQAGQWFQPVTHEQIEAARRGDWQINVTAQKPVPRSWLEPIAGKKVLCLAGGGGLQAPILAALGGEVTVLDISNSQLELDRTVAKREGLEINTVQGRMTDLGQFENASFDWILNPCSLCYIPDVQPVWNESYRVLRQGGRLISGLINPVNYLFDEKELERGKFVVRHKIPYSDLDLPAEERQATMGDQRPIDFGHSMTQMIGGLLEAGFQLSGFFEDRWGGGDKLSKYIDVFFAIHATK